LERFGVAPVSVNEPVPERLEVKGHVQWDDNNHPVVDAFVEIWSTTETKALGHGETDAKGRREFLTRRGCGHIVYALVRDAQGQLLVSTKATPVPVGKAELQVNISVPASGRAGTDNPRATVAVGPLLLSARALEKAAPEIAIDIAKSLVDARYAKKVKADRRPFPDLLPARCARTSAARGYYRRSRRW
jgi:hypothetical protein